MQTSVLFFRSSVMCVLLLLVATAGGLHAQTAADPARSKSATMPDELDQAELVKSYLHVREQLHEAELAIVNNRLEAEATVRAQAASIAEKLDAIKLTIASERERQAVEVQRAAVEQERQRTAARETNRLVLWVAISFGGVGFLTMVVTALLQWRGIKRMAEVTAQPQQLPTPAQSSWLSAAGGKGPSSETVALSNQRMMSVIDRMERRILELEHTATPSAASATTTEAATEGSPLKSTPAGLEQAARIAALLGKGRSLLSANKAPEALACYDEILAIDPNLPEALVKKGSALERLKKDHEALECYDRAIKADRNLALAYLSKGGVFNRLQRFDEAVECYEKALQVEKEGKPGKVLRVSVTGEWPASGSSIPV